MRTGPLDMTGLDRKIAVGASVLMTFSVAVNMVAFQGKGTGAGQGSAIETGGLPSRGGWIEGPGIALGPVSPPTAAPPLPGPTDPPAMAQKDDVNTAELTRGIQRELDARGYDVGQPDGVEGVRRARFAGSAAELADLLTEILEVADGVHLHPATFDVDFEELSRLVLPELRRRGVLAPVPQDGTLRDLLGLKRPASRYAATAAGN